MTPKQQKKADGARITAAYGKVADGVSIPIMEIPRVYAAGETAIAQGADDAALEAAIGAFVATIRCD
jgi:hypothetical protein